MQTAAAESHEGLGGVAKRVGESQADASITYIEREHAGHDDRRRRSVAVVVFI